MFKYICVCTRKLMLTTQSYFTPPIMASWPHYKTVKLWYFVLKISYLSKASETFDWSCLLTKLATLLSLMIIGRPCSSFLSFVSYTSNAISSWNPQNRLYLNNLDAVFVEELQCCFNNCLQMSCSSFRGVFFRVDKCLESAVNKQITLSMSHPRPRRRLYGCTKKPTLFYFSCVAWFFRWFIYEMSDQDFCSPG